MISCRMSNFRLSYNSTLYQAIMLSLRPLHSRSEALMAVMYRLDRCWCSALNYQNSAGSCIGRTSYSLTSILYGFPILWWATYSRIDMIKWWLSVCFVFIFSLFSTWDSDIGNNQQEYCYQWSGYDQLPKILFSSLFIHCIIRVHHRFSLLCNKGIS